MGIDFSRVEKVTPVYRGQYFKLGLHKVKVQLVKAVEGQQGDNFFIIETKILESNNQDMREGSLYSQVINLTNKDAKDAPWGDVKKFVCAALDLEDHEQVGSKTIQFVCKEGEKGNPLEGLEIWVECTQGKTKKGNDFTYHRWFDPDLEMSHQLRAYFEKNNLLKDVEAGDNE